MGVEHVGSLKEIMIIDSCCEVSVHTLQDGVGIDEEWEFVHDVTMVSVTNVSSLCTIIIIIAPTNRADFKG